jgi:hypothetical protein
MSTGDGPLDWGDLVPLIVHKTKLVILEAMLWIDEPLSAVDIERMCSGKLSTSAISYHLKNLAVDHPVLRLYDEEPVRGARKKRYYFRNQTPASSRRQRNR